MEVGQQCKVGIPIDTIIDPPPPTTLTLTPPNGGVKLDGLIFNWNFVQTMTDEAKLCIEN